MEFYGFCPRRKIFCKGREAVLLHNPIAADLDEMRPSVLPNLLLAVKNNIARGYANVSLFEVGPEFYGRKPGEQNLVAAGVRSGMTSKKDWMSAARAYDVFDAKADALAAIAAANGPFESAQDYDGCSGILSSRSLGGIAPG